MQQRYYDPIAGRFLSVDPVVTDAKTGKGFGRYHYAENNPYRYTDPDGRLSLAELLVPVAIVAIACDTCRNAMGEGFKAIATAIGNAVKSEAKAGEGQDGSGKGDKGSKPTTLEPGEHAGESIPARGPERDFTPGEREQINDIGNTTGCHTCGATSPGTNSGNWVPDHQPPNGQNPSGGPQRKR